MKNKHISIIGLGFLIICMLSPTMLFSDDSNTSLVGSWTLNQSLSDDPKEALKKSRSKMRGGAGRRSGGMGGGRGGYGGGMGGDYGPGMGRNASSGGNDARKHLKQGVLTAQNLKITMSDTEFMLDTGKGEPDKYLIDGRGTPLDKELTVVLAGWENDQMVVEKTTGGGQKMFERYTVSSSGSQLHVAISMQRPNSTDMINIQKVFDRLEEQ